MKTIQQSNVVEWMGDMGSLRVAERALLRRGGIWLHETRKRKQAEDPGNRRLTGGKADTVAVGWAE